MAAESSFQTLKMKPSSSKKNTFSNKVEQRAIIKFCVDIGKTPTETHKFTKQSVTHSNVSRSLVFKWHKRFSDGRGRKKLNWFEHLMSLNVKNFYRYAPGVSMLIYKIEKNSYL